MQKSSRNRILRPATLSYVTFRYITLGQNKKGLKVGRKLAQLEGKLKSGNFTAERTKLLQ